MREIKFEIKIVSLRNNKEEEEILILTLDELLNRNGCLYNPQVERIVYKRESTGLTDKNGKEIFEGDIIRIKEDDEEEGRVYSVAYFGDKDYPAFDTIPHVDYDSNGLSYAKATCEIEVIGNIYENKELLPKWNY